MILEALTVGPFASNCYIVGSETTKEGIIIDPGDEAEAILRKVRQQGLSIRLIVATHSHIDHIAALRTVKEETKAEFAMHAEEASQAQQGSARMAEAWLGGSFQPLPQPDRLLQDGDSIEIGDLRFTVLHTPGHTPGGISLFGHGLVFTGDTLFNYGIGRTDFPGGSYSELLSSIQAKLFVLPDDTIVLPGHGPETTIGDERKWNPFLRG